MSPMRWPRSDGSGEGRSRHQRPPVGSTLCWNARRILEAWHTGKVELVLAPDIADEYVRVAERIEVRHDDVEVQPVIALVIQNATLVSATRLPGPVCDDPDDDKFLACARASGADIVVSGDKKLRATSGYEGIQVLTPREFVDHFLSGSDAG